MQYRKEIDGLRAVAVLAVVFFHAGFDWFSGGFAGVDVFFVISGYLITNIIYDHAGQNFSLLYFFERRARRILPALFLVISVSFPLAWLLMVPYQFKDFSLSAVSAVTFVSNVFFWQKSDYFADQSIEIPLLHTWSLSVEGQFYLLYPLFLLVLWRLNRRLVLPSILLLSVMSFVLAEWASRHAPVANFYLAPTRAWELLLGCLAALHQRDRPIHKSLYCEVLSALGLMLIILSVVLFDETTPFPGVYALLPTLGTLLVILFCGPDTAIGRVLSHRTLVGVGLISYSLYLWHLPLFAFAYFSGNDQEYAWEIIIASLGLSYLSWRFVERPCRNARTVRTSILSSFAAGNVALLAGLAFASYSSDGFERLFIQRYQGKSAAIIRALETRGVEGLLSNDHCKFWADTPDEDFLKRFNTCAISEGTATLVIGDSHAMDLYNALFQTSRSSFLVGLFAHGCSLNSTKQEECSYNDIVSFVMDYGHNIGRVFYTQSGSYLMTWNGSEYLTLEEDIREILSQLDQMAASTKIAWLGPQIEPGISLSRVHPATGNMPRENRRHMQAVHRLDKRILKVMSSQYKVTYVSKIDAVDYVHERDFFDGTDYNYSDEDHWSRHGEKLFGARLVDYLRGIGFHDL